MNNKEQIDITSESTKTISWTPTRKTRFGDFPEIEVYLQGPATGEYIKTPIQPSIDAPPPAFTQMNFDFGAPVTGFILIF